MFKRKVLIFALLFIAFIFCFSFNNNNVYAADLDLFNEFLQENGSELSKMLEGYDYLIINNTYQNYITLYYTNCENNLFYWNSENGSYGHRFRLHSSSDLGKDLYSLYIFNINNDNEFVMPTSLRTEFSAMSGNNMLVNNYSLDNILFSNCNFVADDVVVDTKKALPLFTTLAPIVAEVQTQGVVQEILDILNMILVVVVSLLGLRKALSMLSTVLRMS